ncbi:substrate-binding periplasmic protein [Marinobacter salsuginis]|uniref:substrate-binding periplasmic protein n=1 Tax=Marinobacter salsuginis TaxID=418719 RepID=UPI001D18F371|nr:ABC transporter substrate-binding protein [Marinobacter salsuginis]
MAEDRLYLFTQNYPPLHASKSGEDFAHSGEQIEGVCSDMVKTVLSRTDYDYVMKMRSWSYSFRWVQGRENHAVFCTARTNEREELFQWVGPLMSLRWTLFAAPDSDIELASLEDAKDLRIGGYKGDVMSEYLEGKGFNMTMSLSGDLNVRRLTLGQIDLWVADALMGPLVAKQNFGIGGLRPVLEFKETPLYLAFSRNTDSEIVAGVRNAFREAVEAGELRQIIEQKH